MRLDNSFKVDVNGLSNIRIVVAYQDTNDVLFDEPIFDQVVDLSKQIDNLFLENQLFYNFEFELKGAKVRAALLMNLVFIPRNLEAAHLVLNSDLIQANFERFTFKHFIFLYDNPAILLPLTIEYMDHTFNLLSTTIRASYFKGFVLVFNKCIHFFRPEIGLGRNR